MFCISFRMFLLNFFISNTPGIKLSLQTETRPNGLSVWWRGWVLEADYLRANSNVRSDSNDHVAGS